MSKPLQIVSDSQQSSAGLQEFPLSSDQVQEVGSKLVVMMNDIQRLLEFHQYITPAIAIVDQASDLKKLKQYAQKLYRFRQGREKYFDVDLFGEAAWDMLLDLFIAENNGKMVSVTSACIASGVPSTTALRWITILIEKGLVVRRNDPDDRRRAYVRLTKKGWDAMVQCLENALKN